MSIIVIVNMESESSECRSDQFSTGYNVFHGLVLIPLPVKSTRYAAVAALG